MTTDLKPCPFCGGEAMLCSTTSFNGAIAYFVRCEGENCLMRGGTKFVTTASKARDAWNRRAGDGK